MVVDSNKIVIPKGMRRKILHQLHRSHSSTDLFLETLKSMYYWPNMRSEVESMVLSCEGCNQFRPSLRREPHSEGLRKSLLTMSPMENMSSDLFHVNGDPYIVLVDRCSSFIWAEQLRDETTYSVIKFLEGIFYTFGFPRILRTDGGPCFRKGFTTWAKDNYIRHEVSSAYNAESNGLAEVSVKKAKRLIKKTKQMKQNLQQAIFQMRNTVMSKVGASPSEMFFRRETKNPLPCLPKKLDLETAMAKKDNKETYTRRKIHPSRPLQLGERVDVQNMKTKEWDRQATIQRIREGGESFWILIDGDYENVLRNRRYLRPTNESETTHGALPEVPRNNTEKRHMEEPEFHLPESAPQAEQPRGVENSPRATTEDLWCRGKELVKQRSLASPAAQRGAVGSPPAQAACQNQPSTHRSQSRYKLRSQKNRVEFDLRSNTYVTVDEISARWGPQNLRTVR